MPTFAITTLGCKVNAYESQWYREQLTNRGLTEVSDKDIADVYLVNTCSVTNVASQKSRQKFHACKKMNPEAIVCVVGCYVQTNIEAACNVPEIDLVIGTAGKSLVPDLIMEQLNNRNRKIVYRKDREYEMDPMLLEQFDKTRAYLKIQDGCNQFCSYCIIPFARGKERSLPLEAVVQTAKKLVSQGHSELVLTGIHTGRYYDGTHRLADVMRTLLEEIPGLLRLRISSIEMTEVTDEILQLMKENTRIARHLHIPIQTGSDEILKKMNRPYTVEQFRKRVEHIRSMIPDISVSTDVIVGFPEESNELFETTVRNLKEIRFSFLHVFPFSSKKGTVAERMSGHIDNDTKKQRVRVLTELSDELYNAYKNSQLCHKEGVIFEVEKDGIWQGHTSQYIEVFVPSERKDLHGHMTEVTLECVKDGKVFGSI
ncbi:MAG: tRNA (N(6)-L-threonylcarbamoyladenosine(37)-C(2))-methylthiotransferase MtaB [Erysipelotrichaceae bacterium]|nr:tRNA (N(6)-L-threonylcarbamoyladenosine(37)-C(2))-methylthiotransferase MtaB [Erysipelotrichaceae bacterium]